MRILSKILFLLILSFSAFGQVVDIDASSSKFTERSFEWSFYPGVTNTSVSFMARGYSRVVIEPNDTTSYVYTLSRVKKVWLRDSVLVDAIAFSNQSGVVVQEGVLGGVDKGDWIEYSVVFKRKRTKLVYKYALADAVKGQVQFRSGSLVGPVFATVDLPVTGAWNNYQTVEAPINFGDNSGATVKIFLTFTGSLRPTGSGGNIDAFWFK